MKGDVMIDWNTKQTGLWTSGGDPPGLYTTGVKKHEWCSALP